MKKISRLRMELAVRWVMWLCWVVFWPVLLWHLPFSLLISFLICSVWIVGGWFLFLFGGSGVILGKAWRLRDGWKRKRVEELNARFSLVATGEDEGIGLDMDREDDDMLYGQIINEGGISGRDFRVVPEDVRPWFEPYYASDGLLTLHENTCGVERGTVNPNDPAFGQPDMWADVGSGDETDRELEKIQNDLLYAYLAYDIGMGGDDYLVVPSDVRPWFPPYEYGSSTVVHEDSLGVSGETVFDPELLDVPSYREDDEERDDFDDFEEDEDIN